MTVPPLWLRRLGRRDYLPIWEAMRQFTLARDAGTEDELWLLEHPPVYTLGQAGREAHLRNAGGIPVVRTDRGGQITYHGPGQLVAYLLFDLHRRQLGVRRLVHLLENAVIDLLAELGIDATTRSGAPGVYVGDAKIAALGLRVRQGCCYHGLALNLDMDLAPFSRIDPCGYPGLRMTQLADLLPDYARAQVEERLSQCLGARLGCRPQIAHRLEGGHVDQADPADWRPNMAQAD